MMNFGTRNTYDDIRDMLVPTDHNSRRRASKGSKKVKSKLDIFPAIDLLKAFNLKHKAKRDSTVLHIIMK